MDFGISRFSWVLWGANGSVLSGKLYFVLFIKNVALFSVNYLHIFSNLKRTFNPLLTQTPNKTFFLTK